MILELTKIRIDSGTQSRQEISEEVVAEYHEALEDGQDLPAVTVFFDGLSYFLADGFHRYFAHKRSNREMIECEVEQGTVRDALKFSLSANSKHGLRRTQADKRKAVLAALNDVEWSELPSRDIGQMCAVSHVFVQKIRKELSGEKVEKAVKQAGNVSKDQKAEGPTVEDLTGVGQDDAVQELLAENERLQDRLAVEAMEASEEEKTMAAETIESLRAEVKSLQIELDAVKRSRDQYQLECGELKKQIKILQRQLKK
jgi:uncharacterized ParB-like nuclease family protein